MTTPVLDQTVLEFYSVYWPGWNGSFTDYFDAIIRVNITRNWQLTLWNFFQGLMGQPQCTVSKINGQEVLVEPCWDYAWIWRPMWLMVLGTCVLAFLVTFDLSYMLWKATMESSGQYAQLQQDIKT